MKKVGKEIYSQLRACLPNTLRGTLTKALYDLGLKPTVNKEAKSFLKKGIVVFSGDFELSWAWRYAKGSVNYLEKGRLERKNVPEILELLDFYHIPATWATVGHLFLNECIREDLRLPHPDMLRPAYFMNDVWQFNDGDWYDHDPCSNPENAPEWYAPDLIGKILQSKVKHEIACHTFSHIDFSARNCPSELADSEIRKCLQVAQRFYVNLESMVFPGNTFGNFDVLEKWGFICYRQQTAFDIDLPKKDKYGLVIIPDGGMLDKDPYGWSDDFHIKAARKCVEQAIKHRLVCHFWFHPSMDEQYLHKIFPAILKYVSEQAQKKRIDIMTMKDLANLSNSLS